MAACKTGLTDQVDEVHLKDDSSLAALLRFAYVNGICLGVESPGVDLVKQPVQIDIARAEVSHVIQRLLPKEQYIVSESDGAILIRNTEAMTRAMQLDIVVPEFKISRISLAWANMALVARLLLLADPSLQGIGGSVSDQAPRHMVGPLDERGRTVRDLLTLIVGQSSGAAWVAGQCLGPFRAEEGQCWTILDYHNDRPILDSMIRQVVDKLARAKRPQGTTQ